MTSITLVRFLSTVHPLVSVQVVTLNEPHITCITSIWFFPWKQSQMWNIYQNFITLCISDFCITKMFVENLTGVAAHVLCVAQQFDTGYVCVFFFFLHTESQVVPQYPPVPSVYEAKLNGLSLQNSSGSTTAVLSSVIKFGFSPVCVRICRFRW